MYSRDILIKIHNGLHTRIAAMVVNKASELKGKYNTNLYIRRESSGEYIAISMLALLSLKIQENESINISCKTDSVEGTLAVDELCNFISNELTNSSSSMNEIDAIIEENTIANEQIIENIPIGIIVIDSNCYITSINNYALKLLDKPAKQVLGKYVKDIIPTSDLPNIILSKEKQFGKIQHINNHITMVNRSPIFSGNKVIGAIGVFQDVSEIVGMKELNEKFKKILETSHDLICFVDEYRKISYVNPAYEKHFNIKSDDVLGNDLKEVSPTGLRMKVFESKKKVENLVYQKDGVDIISTVEPIFIDNEFKGVISTSKTAEDIKELLSKLEKSEAELTYYKEELLKHTRLNSSFSDIIGGNGTLEEVLNICSKASQSTSTVLIRGESGTGKELIAKAIHNNSERKDKPFVRVNCAAIPENLLESELFGYEKGAFTGALQSKPGKFAIANGGTIFLDEIGDMPTSMQVKLLRVLQEREIESLGGIKPQKIDVRVIAATNQNLEKMIEEKTFREDLYYRLNVINIHMIELKDRKDDILLLANYILNKLNVEYKELKVLSDDVKNCFTNYTWPGNIRELQNVIKSAYAVSDDMVIKMCDLPSKMDNISRVAQCNSDSNCSIHKMVENYEKSLIIDVLKKYNWKCSKAAEVMGIHKSLLYKKIKKYEIELNN